MSNLPVKLKKIIVIVAIIFIITIAISFFLGIRGDVQLKKIIYLTKDFDKIGLQLFLKILHKNVISFILVVISGLLVGFPLVLLILNTHFFVSQIIVSNQAGVPTHILMLFTIPHSIIEFSVLIIATSLGLYIPFVLFSVLINDNFSYLSNLNIRKYIKLFFISSLFLIPAAIIETGMIEFFRAYY